MLEPQLYRGLEAIVSQPSDEPQIEVEDASEGYARMVATPLPPGFGITLGNALRRVLLSSLTGAAVNSVRVDGVQHEFSTIPHVKEDTIEFLLNVKEMRLRALSDRPGTLVLDISGRAGPVTAGDIQVPEHYEIVNPDLYLASLDSKDARLYVEFNVDLGRGYQPAGQVDGTTIGVIPVDAIYSPVRKVNYRIEHTRVGQATNYDKLTMEVWTDGTMSAVEAVSKSAEVLIDQFRLFSHMGRPTMPTVERGLGAGIQLSPDKYNMAIEDLNLSMRAYNCLRRSGLMTVGQVLEKSEEELLALRNFGRKSYDELREKLDEMGLLSVDAGRGDDDFDELPPAPPLDENEAPMRRASKRSSADIELSDEIVEIEPVPVGRRSKKASSTATDGDGEEVPEWKRQLLELTREEDQ
ncbi:MAG: DNA-directed RNA polymerase subunit alpha [Dehalococcoidia bacterium]